MRLKFQFSHAFGLLLCVAVFANAQTGKSKPSATHFVKGTFEAQVTPMPADESLGAPTIGRYSLSKEFIGGMVGTSKGQMLGIGTEIKTSGGYVAAERFTGTLDGKKGSFSLQHSGTMQGGKFDLNVLVVPDSGTGELAGISGKMKIVIEKGKHSYEFEYTLPASK